MTEVSKKQSLQNFYDKLVRFDWFYTMSDDGRGYQRGKAEEADLLKLASFDSEYKALYDQYKDYVWGFNDKTDRPAKPERPQ